MGKARCGTPGCGHAAKFGDRCGACDYRAQRGLPPLVPGTECAAIDCTAEAKVRGLCRRCYKRLYRRVQPDRPRRRRRARPDERRFSFTALTDRMGLQATIACEVLGISGTTYKTYTARGLTDAQADILAVRAGLHPVTVWGWDWVTAGLTPLDEVFLETGWRQAWLWAEENRDSDTSCATLLRHLYCRGCTDANQSRFNELTAP